MRTRNTIEFLGIWEQLNNPDFNSIEFDGIRNQAGLNRKKRWSRNNVISTTKGEIMATNPIGKDTKTIGINMSKKMSDDLEERANSMHLERE
ncbi:hypothetical protein PDESU_04910 [Pontiella desulfatans]|uniref:Uncharacterized protein n=1 Tax=Pontiella desulfatans TaxID=2750659 RepID=A0A6C2U8V9_PONDE|nr:hypothetical protein PDESU_04910 [Pontiella desulfatans]